MVDSRDLYDLLPIVMEKAQQHIKVCASVGLTVVPISTYRDRECQDKLYAQGRTTPGKVVTNARGGESFHNYQCAYDLMLLRNGKPVWDGSDTDWRIVGKLGEECGLDWAGRWAGKLKETAHFQYTGGLTLSDLKAGKHPQ